MPDITGIHHLSLTVSDADASEEFYSKVFGFVRVLDLPDTEGRGQKRVLAHPGSRTIVGLSVHRSHDRAPFSAFHTGLDHLSFGVPSKTTLTEWATKLDELGLEHSEIRSTQVGDLLTLRDPDDIAIELWADQE